MKGCGKRKRLRSAPPLTPTLSPQAGRGRKIYRPTVSDRATISVMISVVPAKMR
jgi:hypothetical protein